jgi:hypothetical protein
MDELAPGPQEHKQAPSPNALTSLVSSRSHAHTRRQMMWNISQSHFLYKNSSRTEASSRGHTPCILKISKHDHPASLDRQNIWLKTPTRIWLGWVWKRGLRQSTLLAPVMCRNIMHDKFPGEGEVKFFGIRPIILPNFFSKEMSSSVLHF